MNKPNANLAFIYYVETLAKTNPLYAGLSWPNAVERARRAATMDLLDGHIRYDAESGTIVQPDTCGDSCIRCRWPESTWVRSIDE
jgi:hypothetical protein